jgi:hypothetical protein
MNKDDLEVEAEVVKAFSAMIQMFFHLDSREVILPWNNKKHVKPITEGKTLPKLKNQWNSMLTESSYSTTRLLTTEKKCHSMSTRTIFLAILTGSQEKDAGTKGLPKSEN